jgi:4-hydroxy-tetrahydrodipicolinate synthase
MITPFQSNDAKSIDYDCLEGLIEWYIRSGVAGLFTVCLSSEMYSLSKDERLQLARFVKRKAASRVPVSACGTFGGSIEEQAKFVKLMSKEVDVVVVIVNQMAKEHEDDDVLKSNLEKLLKLTEDIPLGLYECPAPYQRYLSPEIFQWAASTGRFYFHKDTVSSITPIQAKLQALQDVPGNKLGFYNANATTLKFSLQHGADGYTGVAANFYPWIHTWMCKYWKDQPRNAEIVQQFLSIAETTLAQKYPGSAKVYLRRLCGFPIQETCRTNDYSFNDHEIVCLQQMKGLMEDVCNKTGITPVTF